MRCSECAREAVVRVTTSGQATFACEPHRLAIVRRIADVVDRIGRGNANLQATLVMALDNITFEDLP